MTERWHIAPTGAPSVTWQVDLFGAGLTGCPDQFVLGRVGTGKESPVEGDGVRARPLKDAGGGVDDKKVREDD